jgi:hypothetical protein
MPHILGAYQGASSFGTKNVYYMGGQIIQIGAGTNPFIVLYGLGDSWTEVTSIPITDYGAGTFLMGYINVLNSGLGANPGIQGRWMPWNGSVITRMAGGLATGTLQNGWNPFADGPSVVETLSAAIVGASIQITRKLVISSNISPDDMYYLLGYAPPLSRSAGMNWPNGLASGEYLQSNGVVFRSDTANLGVYYNYKFYIAHE